MIFFDWWVQAMLALWFAPARALHSVATAPIGLECLTNGKSILY